MYFYFFFFFSSRRLHTRSDRDWSSDVCSSDLQWELGLDATAKRQALQRSRLDREHILQGHAPGLHGLVTIAAELRGEGRLRGEGDGPRKISTVAGQRGACAHKFSIQQ